MRIGVDFDNTIVCYDALFHRVALEQKLIPSDLPINKSEVRNHLRRAGQEPLWTKMQGYVYGARMAEAAPFPGVIEFFQECRRTGVDVCIISHKTRHPFLGEKYDLHKAAMDWLEQQGFFDPAKIGLPRDTVFLELTKQAKLERIEQCNCGCFIDDLPEILAEPAFPKIDRILFDPADLYAGETSFQRVRTWAEVFGVFQFQERNVADIEAFLADNGFILPLSIEPLYGGNNNRVYRVTGVGRRAIVKHYFRHHADLRDRFAAERAFYNLVWARTQIHTPEPRAWDSGRRLGLFSFVEGRKLLPVEVDSSAVDQALGFITKLNNPPSERPAGIPPASEACFTLEQHLSLIDSRVLRLQQIEPASDIDQQAVEFVRNSLRPVWLRLRDSLQTQAIPASEHRILSPSDFGFHNALLSSDGRIRFLDFEYAGWDDPAKLICDFFCQPQIPVPRALFWDRVVEAVGRLVPTDGHLANRTGLLFPAYQIKWCCIMLNEFARQGGARRDFAQGAASAEQRKIAQLAKAQSAIWALAT